MKRNFYYSFLILLLFFGSCKENVVDPVLFGTISGIIIDYNTGLALEGATVTTNPATTSVVSDSIGRFTILNVPVGSYSISVKKDGYSKESINLAVKDRITTEARIMMHKSTNQHYPPGLPVLKYPENGAREIPVNIQLRWNPAVEDSDDVIKFDVYFYESESPEHKQIANGITDTVISLENLKYNTAYYWQVIAKDSDAVTNGNVWSFKTRAFPQHPVVFSKRVDGNYEIFSSDKSGGDIVQITDNRYRDYYPRLNSRRTKIAFASDAADVESQLYIMDYDGKNVKQITTLSITGYNNTGMGFCWSPDGGQLYYSHNDRLYRINNDGTGLTEIAKAPANRNFRECEISPLGDKLVVVAIGANPYDSEIYIINKDGSNMRLLVDNLPGVIESPAFSVDGQSIIFVRDAAGFEVPDGRKLDARIYIISTDGSGLTDISGNKTKGTNDGNPRFSPDGYKIIFTNQPNDGSMAKAIYVMDKDGGNRSLIISEGDVPDWR